MGYVARAWVVMNSPALYEWLAKNGYYANGASFAFWSVASTPDGFYTPETELRVPVGRLRILPLLWRTATWWD